MLTIRLSELILSLAILSLAIWTVVIAARQICVTRGTDQAWHQPAVHREVSTQSLPPARVGIDDEIIYFAPGHELNMQREAAAMKAYKKALDSRQATSQLP